MRENNWRRYHGQAPRESVFQDKVMRDLRTIPKSWWEKINDRVTIGVPDILGGINGYSIVIELKTRSKLTRLQLHKLEVAHRSGCQSFVVTPENWFEVFAFLKSMVHMPAPAIASMRKPARIPLWTLPPPKKTLPAKKTSP